MYVCQLFDGYMLYFNKETSKFEVKYTGYPYPDLPKQQFELLYDIIWKYMPKNHGIDYVINNYSNLKIFAKTMIKDNISLSISDLVSVLLGLEVSLIKPKVVVLCTYLTGLDNPISLVYFSNISYASESTKKSAEFKKFFKNCSSDFNGYVAVRDGSRLHINLSSYIVDDDSLRQEKLNDILRIVKQYDNTSNLDTVKKLIELGFLMKQGKSFPFEEMFTEESFLRFFPSYIQGISGFSYLPTSVVDEFHNKLTGTSKINFWGVFGENVISSIFVANTLIGNIDRTKEPYISNIELFLSKQAHAFRKVLPKYEDGEFLNLLLAGVYKMAQTVGVDYLKQVLTSVYKIPIYDISSDDMIVIKLTDFVSPCYTKLLVNIIIHSFGWTGSNKLKTDVPIEDYKNEINNFFIKFNNVSLKRLMFDDSVESDIVEKLGGRRISVLKTYTARDIPIYYYFAKFEITSRRSRKYISLAIKNYRYNRWDKLVLNNLNPNVLLDYTELLTLLAIEKFFNLGSFMNGDLYINANSLKNINYTGHGTDKPVIELRFERKVL